MSKKKHPPREPENRHYVQVSFFTDTPGEAFAATGLIDIDPLMANPTYRRGDRYIIHDRVYLVGNKPFRIQLYAREGEGVSRSELTALERIEDNGNV